MEISRNHVGKKLGEVIIIMKKINVIAFFFSILLLSYSCGQKGPLVMPEKKYPSSNEESKGNNELNNAR